MSKTTSFSRIADLWKEDKRQYVKKSSFAIYVHLLNHFIIPHFAECEHFAEEDIQTFANAMLARRYNVKTVKDTLLVLKMVLKFGAKHGAWTMPEYTVRFPAGATGKKEVPVIPAGDRKRLLNYLRQNFSCRNFGILLCLHTGLRIGEVCGLQWKDFDLESGIVHVGKTVQRIYLADGKRREYYVSIDTPKTSAGIRDIPLSGEILKTVRGLRKVMQDDCYVLSNRELPLEPRYYRDYYIKLLRRLGIAPVRFHALRHTFATLCVESKCDYKTISAILGHSRITTTLDLYVHPGYKEKKRAIEQMVRGMLGNS